MIASPRSFFQPTLCRRSLEAPVCNYWASSFAPYRVVWGKNGRIKEIATDPATHARMVYRKAE